MPPPSLSPVREPGESTNEYLLSPPETSAGIPTPLPENQDPLPCAQPRAPFHESEIPSTNESHSARPSFHPSTFVGRHQCPDFAVKCLASNMFSRPIPRGARPAGRLLFAWAIRAAYCSSVSATECPASTPATTSILDGQTANRHPTKRHSLFRFYRPDLLRSGVVGSSSTSTPVSATARLDGFTPT